MRLLHALLCYVHTYLEVLYLLTFTHSKREFHLCKNICITKCVTGLIYHCKMQIMRHLNCRCMHACACRGSELGGSSGQLMNIIKKSGPFLAFCETQKVESGTPYLWKWNALFPIFLTFSGSLAAYRKVRVKNNINYLISIKRHSLVVNPDTDKRPWHFLVSTITACTHPCLVLAMTHLL